MAKAKTRKVAKAARSTARKVSARKPAARKTTARKAPARKAPARKSAARKPAAKKAAKPRTRAALAKRPPQTFVASHLGAHSFVEGLRSYARYRELGIAAATHGLAQAHVVQFIPPCRPEEVSKLHFHDVDFQMVYVLKGWIKSEFAGEGAHVMREGSCWIQPPKVKHKVLDYSDDCEVLEIILPADFDTVELEK
ncbi:cupin domain protein [Variibacter gotjawalensis]|uniref:Cupin domain protein n=2 Tax=Variibacter gotjawalensis TaxID=1333996 RepID=A0A0S3Q084_9BRAD|nr:mannose-6-phosphate isomerase-like protein (cupin superfamily) [Variibacter gotjawalensis]RZS49306.1 cupin domain [Variibacter gotjawalensis]BAT61570.1 cupin domain protein [Variibacter gotjawalensis]